MNEQWINSWQKNQPIVKIPLQFYFQPVEILSKQLTKLNSPYNYRIHYLGPRWDDSSILHKKYANKQGYKFNDKEINKNNNFFSETMCQNQFYKNQVYYRAFQGMNPTINKQEELQFNSRFQSGNLDCVVKVAQDQYDLFLRIDSNTRGHLFWFYFQITNGKPDTYVKLNICNMTKSIQLYQKGFKPFCSVKNNHGQFKNWSQDPCYDITVGLKRLRYDFIYQKIKGRKLYELSFKYKFTSRDPVRFAYCVPYTYSQMLADISRIESLKIQNLQVGSIGRSLTGVDIPFIMIGKEEENRTQQKNVQICIGRLHPGQTNGSHVLSGLINYICTSPEAQYIRKKVITIFIPMLNPDGVIIGNSRTGAIGKDLNRQFKTRNKALFPQICNLKKFCNKILETNDIEIFLDFHGHSRKKNMFAFGPNYNITQPEYYRARVLPKFISQQTPIFRYFGCDYSIPMGKSTTARAVMLQQLGIPYVYAIEASIGQFFDYQTHKILAFGLKKWGELGVETGRALKQYFESIEQFSQYYKSKMGEYDNKGPSSPSKNQKIPPLLKNVSSSQKTRKLLPKEKDVKLIKVFQQIKAAEEQRKTSRKKPQQSDNQSDSENQQDNLEGKKRLQFEGMVVQCIQTQKKRQQRQEQFEQSKTPKPKIQPPKNPRRKQKQQYMKELMKINTSSYQIDFDSNFNTNTNSNNNNNNNTNRSKQKRIHRSQECTNRYSHKQPQNFMMTNKITRAEYEEIITQHVYFDDVLPENLAEKTKRNNLNLRMFNFSKVIDETESRNLGTSSRKTKNRYLASLRQVNTLDSQTILKQQNVQLIKMNNTLNKVSLDQGLKILECEESPQKQTNNYVSGRKMKGLYPASFYRIKYQNYQKKKKQRYVEQFREENKLIDEDFKMIEAHRKRESLFLNIKKFDNNQ